MNRYAQCYGTVTSRAGTRGSRPVPYYLATTPTEANPVVGGIDYETVLKSVDAA